MVSSSVVRLEWVLISPPSHCNMAAEKSHGENLLAHSSSRSKWLVLVLSEPIVSQKMYIQKWICAGLLAGAFLALFSPCIPACKTWTWSVVNFVSPYDLKRLIPWEFIEGGAGGSELPAFRTLYSRFLLPSVAVSVSVCFSYRARNIVPVLWNFSHFSWLPPPLDFPPPTPSSPASRRLPAPITPGFPPPPVPPHHWAARLILNNKCIYSRIPQRLTL